MLAGVIGLAGVWLHEGRDGVLQRIPGLRGKPGPERRRTASVELDLAPDGIPLDGYVFVDAVGGAGTDTGLPGIE